MLGVVAIAGLPPLGIFMSEFLVVSSTVAREPLLVIPLVGGILVAFGALFLRLNGLAFGEPTGPSAPVARLLRADVPAFRPGLRRRLLPSPGAGRLVPARRGAAGVMAMAALAAIIADGVPVASAPPVAARSSSRASSGVERHRQRSPRADARSSSLWAEPAMVHMALSRGQRRRGR